MKTLRILALIATLTATAMADGKPSSDTIVSVLTRQVGQRVELRMNSGEKIAGKVEAVGDKTVHIASLAGQEFFDAVVALDQISAVIYRTAGK